MERVEGDGLTAADRAALAAIWTADDDRSRLDRLIAYWRDDDRSARTPREMLYLHLGIVAGICLRLLDERATP